MPAIAKDTKATVIPCLCYRDAPAAIDWLCRVFGFEKQLVVPGKDDAIAHAQLSFGNGMIMVGSVKDTVFGRLMKQPDEIGAIYTRAKAAKAEILLDIKDEDYGGRGFTCRDLEGHLWTFGTYDPWEA